MSNPEQDQVAAGIISGVVAALIWGAWPAISVLAIEADLDAFDITALRFGISGLILAPVLVRRGLAGVPVGAVTLMVTGAGVPYVLLGIFGLKYAPAGHFGVISPSIMLCFATLGGWKLLGDRPDRRRLAGLAVIIAGVVLIGLQGLSGAGASAWKGDLIFVGCGSLWAVYTLASKVCGANPLHATTLVSVISCVVFMPAYLWFRMEHLAAIPLNTLLVQGVFHGVLIAVVALLAYTRATAILGASRGAVFAALVPGTALLIALFVLAEIPTPIEIAGLVLVTLGMVLALGLIPSRSLRPTPAAASSASN